SADPGGLAFAQRRRQEAGEDFADRMVVVAAGPQGEVEDVARHDRLPVENFQRALELPGGDRSLSRHLQQDADGLGAAERDAHTHAGLQRFRIVVRRRQVIKAPVRGRRDGDTKKGTGGRHGANLACCEWGLSFPSSWPSERGAIGFTASGLIGPPALPRDCPQILWITLWDTWGKSAAARMAPEGGADCRNFRQ